MAIECVRMVSSMPNVLCHRGNYPATRMQSQQQSIVSIWAELGILLCVFVWLQWHITIGIEDGLRSLGFIDSGLSLIFYYLSCTIEESKFASERVCALMMLVTVSPNCILCTAGRRNGGADGAYLSVATSDNAIFKVNWSQQCFGEQCLLAARKHLVLSCLAHCVAGRLAIWPALSLQRMGDCAYMHFATIDNARPTCVGRSYVHTLQHPRMRTGKFVTTGDGTRVL